MMPPVARDSTGVCMARKYRRGPSAPSILGTMSAAAVAVSASLRAWWTLVIRSSSRVEMGDTSHADRTSEHERRTADVAAGSAWEVGERRNEDRHEHGGADERADPRLRRPAEVHDHQGKGTAGDGFEKRRAPPHQDAGQQDADDGK